MREWTDLSMSSIYKLLRQLEKEKLVSSNTVISEGNRARKIYALTNTGQKALKQKVLELLTEPEQTKWQLDIAISNLAILKTPEALECLKTYRTTLEDKITGYGDLEKYLKQENCPPYKLALAKRPVHILKGELNWIDAYIAELESVES